MAPYPALVDHERSPVRVFLVDDHEVVRRGVAEVLEEDPGITVAGEAGSVAEALARVPAVRPDVVLVDMRLPDGDGVELCRQLRARVPGCRSLVLTSFVDEEDPHLGGFLPHAVAPLRCDPAHRA